MLRATCGSPVPQPCAYLLRSIRASLVLRGTSLTRWSRENGYSPSNVRKALLGDWTGPKAEELVRRLASETGQG